MISTPRSRTFVLALVILAFILAAITVERSYARPGPKDQQLSVASIESLGVVTFETGFGFAGTEVGGLSGIAYDSRRDVYYVVSDERAEPRYYTVAIDLGSDSQLDPGDITFLDVTFLRDQTNDLYPPDVVDAESIILPRPGTLYISSEGDVSANIDPFVNRYNVTGKQTRSLPLPEKFLIGGINEVRDNLAFESLAATPNGRRLYTASENALLADGPIATPTEPSPSRMLEYTLGAGRPGREFIYVVSPIPVAPAPGDFADNGLSEMEALDNRGTFLALERAFIENVGNIVRLFETSTDGATDVSDFEVLPEEDEYETMSKELVADFESDLGVDPDNLEAMRFGPALPDGRRLLIVVSDNNFNPSQVTQFIALAVELEVIGGD